MLVATEAVSMVKLLLTAPAARYRIKCCGDRGTIPGPKRSRRAVAKQRSSLSELDLCLGNFLAMAFSLADLLF